MSIPVKKIRLPRFHAEIKHMYPAWAPGFVRCLGLGATKSGKSTFLLTALPTLHKFKHLFIFAPTQTTEQPIYKKLIRHYMKKDVDVVVSDEIVTWPEFAASPYDIDAIPPKSARKTLINAEILNMSEHNVVIFDDLEPYQIREIGGFFKKSRHQHLSVFLLYQNFSAKEIPPEIVKQLTHLAIFRQSGDITSLYKYISTVVEDFEDFKRKMKEVGQHQYNYLFVDIYHPIIKYRARYNMEGKIIDFD